MNASANISTSAASWLLIRREIIRFIRQPSRIVGTLGTPLLLWAFLGSGFAGSFSSQQNSYAGYLLPGMVTMTVLFGSIFASISLIEDRREGFLQSILVSPLPTWALVASKTLGTSAIVWIQSIILLPAAYLLGKNPDALGLVQAGIVIACICVGITGLGLALAWLVNSSQGFHGVMNLILMPMWLLSGAFFPLSGASSWLRLVMLANPLTWSSELLRVSINPDAVYALPGSPVLGWVACLGFALFGMILASATLGKTKSTRKSSS